MNNRLFSSLGLVGVLLATVVLAPALAVLLRGHRINLTQGQIYTLSDGSRSLLSSMETPVDLTLYFSDEITGGMPDLRNYAGHVRDLLHEMAAESGGKLRISERDPAPFSEAQDAADAANLQSIQANTAGDAIYLGLVGRNSRGRQEVVPFFQPNREQFLEYDIAKLIHSVGRDKPPSVGLITQLQVAGQFDFQTGQPAGAWASIAQLQQLVDVQRPSLADAAALAKLDVLILIHPQRLQAIELFNLDQFVLRGGRLLLFLDPHAEHQSRGNPMQQAPDEDLSSDLAPLLRAWGVRYDRKQVVGDARYAMTVTMSESGPPVRHLGILTLDGDAVDRSDVVTAQLERVNFASAGALIPIRGASTKFTALVRSSTDAALLDAERFKFLMDPTSLTDGFTPGTRRLALMARVQGPARTAFPGGMPAAARAATAAPTPASAGGNNAASVRGTGQLNIIIVADTDMLTDLMWVQSEEFFGQTVARPWAGNGDLLLNAVENLSGSTALASIRGRAQYQRPFTRVQALMRRADERMIEQERALEQQLSATEAKLAQLERSGQGGDGVALTPAQQAEIQRFQQQKLSIRKHLRQVQRDLTVDIDRLGNMLKLLNMLAVPAVLTLLLVGWQLRRRWRGKRQASS